MFTPTNQHALIQLHKLINFHEITDQLVKPAIYYCKLNWCILFLLLFNVLYKNTMLLNVSIVTSRKPLHLGLSGDGSSDWESPLTKWKEPMSKLAVSCTSKLSASILIRTKITVALSVILVHESSFPKGLLGIIPQTTLMEKCLIHFFSNLSFFILMYHAFLPLNLQPLSFFHFISIGNL